MRLFSIATLTAISLSMAAPLVAQQVPTDLPEIKAEDVTVGQVVSFVNAMIAAERVRQEYLGKIEAAETEDEINALVAEADQKGMAEVERVPGISPAEYMAIAIAAKDNEELSDRIQERLTELTKAQELKVIPNPNRKPKDEATE